MISALALAAVVALGPVPQADNPAVTFEQSGGITGWVTHLTITPSGHATVIDRTGARHDFTLSAAEQRRVARRLAAADLPDIAGRHMTVGAADLFVYRVASGGAHMTADQLAVPDQAGPLIRTLMRLTNAARWAPSTGG